MTLPDRHARIMKAIDQRGSVEVDEMVMAFGVSAQTIRNDLRQLDSMGLVLRTHGGARKRTSVGNRDYAERRRLNTDAKRTIAARAAALVPDGASVALNIGTTTEHVADALFNHKDLLILSNNINIISRFTESLCRELILVGGAVRKSDGAIVGEDAVSFISSYKVDYAIIGASSIDADGAILDFDAREVAVARALIANSRKRILVCDASKFQVTAPIRICTLSDLDFVVTDRPTPPKFKAAADSADTILLSG